MSLQPLSALVWLGRKEEWKEGGRQGKREERKKGARIEMTDEQQKNVLYTTFSRVTSSSTERPNTFQQ